MISDILKTFQPIELQEAWKVKLFDRTDTKYIFNINLLPDLLERASKEYFILNTNESGELHYSTQYYDTDDFCMYLAHHNKKTNRVKIRIRNYLDTNTSFFEIKTKIKGTITSKRRITIKNNNIDENINIFISKNSPFELKSLHPSLSNNFIRLFLVAKNLNERVTIDYNLNFKNDSKSIQLENIAIAEIKREKHNNNSLFSSLLKDNLIRPAGFSKYCVGMALTNDSLKQNRFKKKILLIHKIQNQYGYFSN